MTKRVLLVDDDRDIREALGQTLELADLEPTLAGSFVEAKDHMTRSFDGVIVSDIRMPGRDGFHLLDYVREADPELPVILLTGEADIPMAVRAMSAGAYDFLEKPCAPQDFVAVVLRAQMARRLVLENRRLKTELEAGDAASRMLVGRSKISEELRAAARAAARAGTEVLIMGEPGSGTPKMAEVIHLLSDAASRPFVKRAASSLDAEALAAAIAEAGAGTLYLDEITGLNPALQLTLLDRLEEGGVARVLAGTTRNLSDAMAAGQFNAELFYRLDLMRVRIASLRERPEDIPVLFEHYVSLACEQANLAKRDITADVTARLMAQDWPGNARALMNAAMRFALGLDDDEAQVAGGLSAQMAQVERSLLIAALQRHSGRVTDVAKDLKLPRKTFYDKLTKHGLRAEDYRPA
ncbi:two-component system, NtrC family, C4-dicarboxylate transport response regulator DctD [Yoonia tamlensis]|uniref:Two-component system, NtrC family, C4-dicarboxylate transport response regulator DctD n=1 Tax=Yoonia tamlensis TaxID=390270 RepID=A0A1I6G3Y7_9RHOB|nr:sigma-54 dependent transcriptional regulator [Yoonia tamlensis]SFR36882.1 two-component system, NtrC family, C4-dicarboxylate transport response regulator DctD [Yoonia tamlensis]